MGWFDNQIEERKRIERELLSDSFDCISHSVTGKHFSSNYAAGVDTADALSKLLEYFSVSEKEIPAAIVEFEDKLDFLLTGSGVQYRKVELTSGWHKDSFGVLVGSLKDSGAVVTMFPGAFGGYEFSDPVTGKKTRVTHSIEKNISPDAFVFYRPLPQRKLKVKDIFSHMFRSLTVWDYVSFAIAALVVTLIGMLIPKLNHILMGEVIENNSYQLLLAVMGFMFFATVSSLLFSTIRSLLLSRIGTKMNAGVRSAAMMRVLSLPAPFFKNYSAGELNQYLSYLNQLCKTMTDSILSTGITGIFSLVYFTQIFAYAKSLIVPSIIVTVITLVISVSAAFLQISISKEIMTETAKEKGFVFSLISGIQKIRLSGAENRAFSKWAKLYSRGSELTYNPPLFVKMSSVITSSITLIGTAIMFWVSVKSKISVADYYAFNSSFAYISGAFSAIAAVAVTVSNIRPGLAVLKPFLDAEPEISDGLEVVSRLSGSIELSHVSFRYEEDGPDILEDLSLEIPAKQYVAIVGKSGCGKSTLIRLLLGFEMPTKGAIFYNKKDTRKLNMASVRRQIGTVMQDSKLFGGSIYENITISAPNLSLADAWEAAKTAGIAEDIEAMPMKMGTVLQEGYGGISGGQRQRLMIARAIAPKPRILIFDEATSALDNITQKKVSQALDEMKCTRIVIAHRLSTIRYCDRILVLDKGKIIEDGTYDELIEQDGFFADLVKRQRLDDAK